MKTIGVINGPNLNKLGTRNPQQYGSFTLDELTTELNALAKTLECKLVFFQSNHEGELIEKLHEWTGALDGFIINPGGYSHTSVALRDAIECSQLPGIEVHISNVHSRESFRQTLITASACKGCITGFGKEGYLMALTFLAKAPNKEA